MICSLVFTLPFYHLLVIAQFYSHPIFLGMVSLECADMPLRNCSLTHYTLYKPTLCRLRVPTTVYFPERDIQADLAEVTPITVQTGQNVSGKMIIPR